MFCPMVCILKTEGRLAQYCSKDISDNKPQFLSHISCNIIPLPYKRQRAFKINLTTMTISGMSCTVRTECYFSSSKQYNSNVK